MDNMTDHELLRQYATDGSDEAFRLIVQRHLGLVRGTAMRQLANAHYADEVSHAVFIALARKASSLPKGTVIAGWLFKATRFAAAKLARDEERRTRREREAAMTHTESISGEKQDEIWKDIAPHLNEALESLAAKDRDALLLRFFEGQSFTDVGEKLGASEDAAKMRTGRALEKLRLFFRKRGFTLGVAVLAGALSSRAMAAATANLQSSVTASAAGGSGATGTAGALADSILGHFRLIQWKYRLAVIGGLLLAGAIVGITGHQLGWFGRSAPAPAWPPPAQQWPPK